MNELMKKEYIDAIRKGDAKSVQNLTEEAIKKNVNYTEIIKCIESTLRDIGEKYKNYEVFIPDLLRVSRAAQAGTYVLMKTINRDKLYKGRVVIGTVAGDLHDIGKKIVAFLMMAKGIDVIDIGIDVTSEEFVGSVVKYKPDILAMSALLTTTMNEMKNTINLLIEKKIRNNILIMVGGGPVNEEYANNIGADVFAEDAISAAEKAIELINNKSQIHT